jgi:hypothetical protein
VTLSTTGIATLEDLRTHLQWAIELEHSTLPPYFCALYSIDPTRNAEAAQVVGGVFVEEMLHLLLAANLLNAVGDDPVLDAPHLLPSYPHPLPHSDGSVRVELAPFGPEALELFLRIEQPARADARAQADGYTTIGQFYAAIEDGLRGLCATLGEEAVFCGDPGRQVRDVHLSQGGGRVVAVQDLASALDALGEIVEQGEGAARTDVWDGDRDVFHPEREEVAHYFRFVELKEGRRFRAGDTPQSGPTGEALAVDLAGVLPMRPNPRTADHAPGSDVRLAQEEFNRTYCALLHELEAAFTGSPARLGAAIGMMYARAGADADADAQRRRPDDRGPHLRVRTAEVGGARGRDMDTCR